MAIRVPVEQNMGIGLIRYQWGSIASPLLQGDTCEPVNVAKYKTRLVRIEGSAAPAVFGGATLSINEKSKRTGAVMASALTDVAGAPISRTTEGVQEIRDHVELVVPVLTGGGATTALMVELLVS